MIQKRTFSVRSLLIFILAILSLFSSPSLAATIRVPADQSTIQAAIDVASVGDTIIVENHTPRISHNMQILKGKAIESISEELFLNKDQRDNTKRTRTLLRVRAERPTSIKSKASVANAVAGSCPFPSPPIEVEATLIERRNGGVTEQANFYVWVADGKLYVAIDPITSSFEISAWAYDHFYVVQDGLNREVFLMDCNGQMYDDEIVIFATQTFELKDDPSWTGAAFDVTRFLTLGFTAMNGDNYKWDLGTGIHVPIPPVPTGLSPTLVERQLGSEEANFYVWAADGKLYVNIDPVTSGFEIHSWSYDKFYVTQDGLQHEVFLMDCNGQMYDDEIVIFATQTFELKDDPSWTGAAFDVTRFLTLGFTAMNGPSYSWDVGSGSPVVIPPVPDGVEPILVERRDWGVTEQAKFYVWPASGKLYVNVDPITSSFGILFWAYDHFYLTQEGYHRKVFLVDCAGKLHDHEIVVFSSQTFEIQDDPDWAGPAFKLTEKLTLGFTAMNGGNYSWDIGSGSHVIIPPVPDGIKPTLVERQFGSEKANFYVWAADGRLYVNINPVTSGFEIMAWAWDKFYVTQDGSQHEVYLTNRLGEVYDDETSIFTAITFQIQDDPDWTGPDFDATRFLTLGFTAMNDDNYSWDVIPQCPECAVHPVVLGNVIFEQGTTCECSDGTSITIGSGVTIESGAKVIFKAPKITVKSGAQFKSGSEVSLKQK
jgi:hypothetical protein